MTDEELTRQVAEEVMGWYASDSGTWLLDTVINQEPCAYSGEERLIFWRWDDDIEHSLLISDWNPLTDPRHWMEVVEKMIEKGFACEILMAPDLGYPPEKENYCEFRKSINLRLKKWWAIKKGTAGLVGYAVCEAALAAVRGEKNELDRPARA